MAHLLENTVAGTKLAKLIGEYFLDRPCGNRQYPEMSD